MLSIGLGYRNQSTITPFGHKKIWDHLEISALNSIGNTLGRCRLWKDRQAMPGFSIPGESGEVPGKGA
jgi:hypothetical protein